MYEEISRKIHQAEATGNKVAMFHLQVLLNAHQLERVDPVEFCTLIKVNESYATEFRKMISLAKLMDKQGIKLE